MYNFIYNYRMGRVANGKPGLFCTLLIDTRPLGMHIIIVTLSS